MRRLCTSLVVFAACTVVVSCAPPSRDAQTKPGIESSYLLVSAGDADAADSDFLAVIDLRPDSPDLGKAIATMPTGIKSSMPHHMEYAMPPAGELLFLNAHHHEMSMLLDVSNPRALRVADWQLTSVFRRRRASHRANDPASEGAAADTRR